MNDFPPGKEPGLPLLRLEESDRARLGEALRTLLDRGSILGEEDDQRDLYVWCFQSRGWLEEMSALLELELYWEPDSRFVQAVPNSSSFMLRLRLDATLVLLTLWYEFDTAVRDRGETPPVVLTAQELNSALETRFVSLHKVVPTSRRLLEILRLAARKNLVRFTPATDPSQTRIYVLPTIKRTIPFQDLADWTRHAERFLPDGGTDQEKPPEDDHDAEH